MEEDLVIHEYNVDTINFSELTVTKDGTARDLEEGTDFTVEEEEADGRKHYVYTLNREIFTEERQTEDGQTETVPSDGHYTITVYSEDEAGNRSSNQRTGGYDSVYYRQHGADGGRDRTGRRTLQ